MTELDKIVPEWCARERHKREVPGATADVLAAVDAVTWRDTPLARKLMMVRGDKVDRPVVEEMRAQMGFVELARTENEMVAGSVLRVGKSIDWNPAGADPASAFRDFAEPGHIKIAYHFLRDGELLRAETRVQGTSAGVRRMFKLYWLVIRIPSGMIRKEWLKAIAKRVGAKA